MGGERDILKSQYTKYARLIHQIGCEGKATATKCGCCPPGLVSVFDTGGKHAGCLTPSDAIVYNKYIVPCKPGFIKYFSTAGQFLGCVEEAELLIILTTQNP